jgi:hypothetical protein
MVLNNIEKLLEKYENGETTLKEEQQLKHYFLQGTVAPHLEMYRPMFAYFSVNQQEQFTKDVPLTPMTMGARRSFSYKWISVAAVAVLLIGVYFKSKTNNDLGTYQDPQMAYNEVVKSLAMISNQFNKGVSTVGYLDEMNKGTAALEYLDEIKNTRDMIFKPVK